jgi:hypothetical protein
MSKRLSCAIALMAALMAMGGPMGFPWIAASLPAAFAAAEGAAPAAAWSPGSTPWIAPDQEAARKRSQEVVPFVVAVMDECQLCRRMRLRETGLGIEDITHSYFLLESPIIKQTEDLYGPVRFKHSKHAAQLKDCALCHHYRPLDAQARETTRCSACHQEAFRADQPERLGLKAAFHQQCSGCHEEMQQGPTDCLGCHRKNVPDHKELVQLADNPPPSEVTRECLRCHQAAGQDMLKSAHWLWKGPSPYTLNRSKHVEHGKATSAVNNF